MKKPCNRCDPPRLIEASDWIAHLNWHSNNRPGRRDLSYRNTEWRRLRRIVLQRDGYRCRVCGVTQAQLKRVGEYLEVHHLIEASAGGPDSLSNLEARCPLHNPRGGKRPTESGM